MMTRSGCNASTASSADCACATALQTSKSDAEIRLDKYKPELVRWKWIEPEAYDFA